MMRAALALGGALALAGCASGDRVTLLGPAQADKLAICEAIAAGTLEPVAEGEVAATCDVGAVAVIDDEAAALSQEEYEALFAEDDPLVGAESDLAFAVEENQQVRLRRRPSVRSYDEAPDGASLLADLPLEVQSGEFSFESGEATLSPEVLEELAGFLSEYVQNFEARYPDPDNRPELQIEIRGFADSAGYSDLDDERDHDKITERNEELSYRRAAAVYYQLLELVRGRLPIEPKHIEVVKAGDHDALIEATKAAAEGERVRRSNEAYRKVEVVVR